MMNLFFRNKSYFIVIVLAVTVLTVPACTVFQRTSESETESQQQKETADFEETIEHSVSFEGLFTVYQDSTNGSVKLAVREDQIDKEYIYFGMTRDGVLEAGHFRGQFQDNKIIRIRRYFDRLEFVHVNNRYHFDEESPLSRSAAANISDAVLYSAEIEAEDKEKGVLLIDGDGLFLSENLHQIKPSPNPAASPGQYTLGNLSSEKSKYTALKSYPKNTDIVVEYVFDSPYPTGSTSDAVTDARAVSITFQHTLIEMPENEYRPRFADPRVGYFTTEVDDQVSVSPTPYRDMIHRWHLVKKDPEAELSEPVEPIVWWIENTTPHEFRETIKEATLAWNEAFEAAGFKNAIQVKVQPDDAEWDAGDIRYNVLRWTSSPRPPFGGYGPSFVNPRTGQILGADIMLEWVFFTNRLREDDIYTENFSSENPLQAAMDPRYCSLGQHLHYNRLFGSSALNAWDATPEELSEFQKEAITMLVLHELGHTFALNHNMQASTLHSPEEIHDKELADTVGLTGSVMDYSSVNVNRNRDKQGRYFDIKPGPYDIWAIQYGYTTVPGDPEAEQALLDEILSRSTEPELAFGNDADDMRAPGRGIDPRVMIGDMSQDPVAYGIERIRLVRELQSGLLEKFGTREGQSYQELRNIFMMLMNQYRTQTGVMSRQIAGVYRDRAFIGQEGGKKPFIPVEKERQKQAMASLSEYLFAPDAFDDSHEVYQYLQIQRRGFNFFGSNEDPKIHDMVLSMQANVLNHLLHRNTLLRLTDSRTYGNQYTAAEMMDDLTKAVFEADAEGNVNTFRQNLQVDYVNRLISLTENDAHDHIAKSAALYHLHTIYGLMDNKGSINPETRAHTSHIKHLIDKAME